MFSLNLVDYPMFSLLLSSWKTWDTLLILRVTKVIYMDYVGTLRPSKSYGWVVTHKILVTSPESKFLFPFGLGAWTWD